LNYILAAILWSDSWHGLFELFKKLTWQRSCNLAATTAFNIGLEIGQLVIVGIFILATSIFVGLAGVKRREWTLIISAFVMGIAMMLMLDTKFW